MLYLYLFLLSLCATNSLHADEEYNKRQVIDFLTSIEDHGFSVSSEHWEILLKNPTQDNLKKLYKKYSEFIDTGRLNKNIYQSNWMIPDIPGDFVGDNLSKSIDDIQSNIKQYKTLKYALYKLRWWQTNALYVFPNDIVLFEGDETESVKDLNKWMLDLGLLVDNPGDIYSSTHLAALTQVQMKFKLSPDGRLGPSSRGALISITNHRIKILQANLERLRWLPKELPSSYIWVDIPGFTMSFVANSGEIITRRAIIGKQSKQTPIFKDEIESITINPIWKVPHRIAATYLLRNEKKNPGTLKKEGFFVYQNWNDNAKRLNPNEIPWNKYTQKTFKFRLEQQPDETNRLGKYRFDMPNEHGVYLHDTDKRELFEKEKRMFSSGCTRIDGIKSMIEHVLSSQNISAPLDDIVTSKITKKVLLNNNIPVYLTYFTAWPDENGNVLFRDDIYYLDHALTNWF